MKLIVNIKLFLNSLYCRICDYNLFIHDGNGEENPTRTLQYQKYTTRLYLVLLLSMIP